MNLPNSLTIARIFFVPLLVALLVQERISLHWHGATFTNDTIALGIFWIVLGLAGLVWAPHTTGLLAVSAAWLAVGTGNLVAAVVLRLRKRSLRVYSGP